MKKSERHLTSTLMDVWWLGPDPPHGDVGFQRVIHRLTFLLPSSNRRMLPIRFLWQTLGYLLFLRKTMFLSRNNLCGCVCMSVNSSRVWFEWSLKHTGPFKSSVVTAPEERDKRRVPWAGVWQEESSPIVLTGISINKWPHMFLVHSIII